MWIGSREKFRVNIEYDDDTQDWFYFDYSEGSQKVIDAFKMAICGQEGVIEEIGFVRPVRRPFFNDETTLTPSAYDKPLC